MSVFLFYFERLNLLSYYLMKACSNSKIILRTLIIYMQNNMKIIRDDFLLCNITFHYRIFNIIMFKNIN